MEDMFYAIIGLAFIITLAVLAQKRRNKHFTKKCPKCGYPTVHPKPTGLKYTGGCPSCSLLFIDILAWSEI